LLALPCLPRLMTTTAAGWAGAHMKRGGLWENPTQRGTISNPAIPVPVHTLQTCPNAHPARCLFLSRPCPSLNLYTGSHSGLLPGLLERVLPTDLQSYLPTSQPLRQAGLLAPKKECKMSARDLAKHATPWQHERWAHAAWRSLFHAAILARRSALDSRLLRSPPRPLSL
jgi:hypothetical protein